MSRRVRIIGAAYGNPMRETVFSGVSKYLFSALDEKGVMSGYLSTRQLRPWDVFDHLLDMSKIFESGRPQINPSWIWRRSTIDKLTARVMKRLEAFDDFDAVLQVGTHAIISYERTKHFVFTDMTVVQAVNSPNTKTFTAGRLTKSQQSEAIEAQRVIFESCEAMFVNSNWAKDSIVNDYNIEPDRVNVVGVGVSLPLQPLSDRKKESHDILFIGRDWVHKGGPMLVEAFSLVRRKFKDATLTVIGCNPRINDKNVHVLGKLDKNVESERRRIEKALATTGVFCVPSIFEAYGICFLEAQLHGVVPVTFVGEGRGDAIKNGQTGILLEERTAEALSGAIIDLFSNPEKARGMGCAGHEYVVNNLTWDRIAERVLTVIENRCKC